MQAYLQFSIPTATGCPDPLYPSSTYQAARSRPPHSPGCLIALMSSLVTQLCVCVPADLSERPRLHLHSTCGRRLSTIDIGTAIEPIHWYGLSLPPLCLRSEVDTPVQLR